MNLTTSAIYKNTQVCLCVAAILFALFSNIWVMFFSLPQIIKLIVIAAYWAAIFFLPSRIYLNPKIYSYQWIYFLLAYGVFQIFVTVFNQTDIYLDLIGNRYITLLGNDAGALFMLMPVFAFFPDMWNKGFVYGLLCTVLIPLILLHPRNGNIGIFLIILIPYCGIGVLPGLIAAMFALFYIGTVGEERMSLLMLLEICGFLLLLLYQRVFRKKFLNRRFIGILCTLCILMPLFAIAYTIIAKESFFSLLTKISLGTLDNLDTRTFLYVELFADLLDNNAFLFGKGAISHYYSPTFKLVGDSDFYYRINVEVTMLSYLLKGGLIYCVLYSVILIKAVRTAIKKSKNMYLLYVALALSIWYAFGYMGNYVSFSLFFLCMWIFIGQCLSPAWLERSDSDIKNLLKMKAQMLCYIFRYTNE